MTETPPNFQQLIDRLTDWEGHVLADVDIPMDMIIEFAKAWQETCLPILVEEVRAIERAARAERHAAIETELDAVRRDLAANEGSEDARLAVAEREVARLRHELSAAVAAGRRQAAAEADRRAMTYDGGARYVLFELAEDLRRGEPNAD